MPRPRKRPGEIGKVGIDRIGQTFRARAMVRDGAGAKHHLNAYADTAEAAEAGLREKARRIWAGEYIGLDGESTLEQLSTVWLAHIERKDEDELRESSKVQYRRNAAVLLNSYRATQLNQFTTPFVNNVLERIAHEQSRSAASNARKTLSMMLGYAVKQGALIVNPVRDADRIKSKPAPKIELTPTQFVEMIMLIRSWKGRNPERRGGARPQVEVLEDFLCLALGSSARPSEILGFRLDDITFVDDRYRAFIRGKVEYVAVEGSRARRIERADRLKHDSQNRRVTMPRFADAAIRRRLAGYRPNDQRMIFTTRNSRAMTVNYIERMMRDFREQNAEALHALGIPDLDLLTPYAMRKTAATVVTERYGVAMAARLLGHSDDATTRKHYVGEIDDVPGETADALDAAFRLPIAR